MKIDSTPIPSDEHLAMLKQDAIPLLRSDNRTLSNAVIAAIRQLERSVAELDSRKH